MDPTENIKKQLIELDAFLASDFYEHCYLVSVRSDIDSTKESILRNLPVGDEAVAKDFQLRGELAQLESELTFFQEARVTLKAKLDEKTGFDNENTTTHI